MAGSGAVVNYNIRPCKNIERKMMCEMISCLATVDDLSEYRYIGMGAKYFVDFIQMHKKFGIKEMYSLETMRTDEVKKRFEFNKPFNCINLVFKNSTEWLSSTGFRWKDKKDIIWFDYDGSFTSNQLKDVEFCAGKVQSGSMIFVSTSLNFGLDFDELDPKEKLARFCERVDNESYTKHLQAKNFAAQGLYRELANTFSLVINDSLLRRNIVIENDSKKMYAERIAYFAYTDSLTPMVTLGWIFFSDYDKEKITQCGIDRLSFYNKTNVPYDISVPNFTYKELAVLNKNMPNVEYPIVDATFFSQEEVEAYKKIYRYYPTTVETNTVL